MKRSTDRGVAALMINGTERFDFSIGITWQRTVKSRVEQSLKYRLIESRHVAGNNQVKVGSRCRERSLDSGEGTRARKMVGNNRKPQLNVFRRLPNKSDIPANGSDFFRDGKRERAAVNIHKRFVGTHPGAAPARQNPARPGEFMQHLVQPNGMVTLHILGRICFMLLLAVPAFAARVSGHVTTTVHADVKSGKLVRTTTAQPREIPRQSTESINRLIDRISAEQGVESPLVHSVIQAESNYNPAALSPKGAQGMMQLIPATAKRFGVANAFDTGENIQGGVRYLKFLLDYFHGDYVKAIAAYNAGEGSVDKYKGIPPYQETRNYVRQVAKNLKVAREKQIPALVKPVAVTATAPPRILAALGTDGRLYYRTP